MSRGGVECGGCGLNFRTNKALSSTHSRPLALSVQLDSSSTVMANGDAGGEVKGKLANAVGSQYSSLYFGTWCIQRYYR